MRTIKFRGRDICTGEWIYGDLRQRAGCFPSIIHSFCNNGKLDYCETPIHRDSLGQFTGLFDKNGKEIYEGDFVKAKYTKRGEVKYLDVHFCVDFNGYQALIGGEEYEVVGNIHDKRTRQEITYEYCPWCDTEVRLKAQLSVQKCPSCGKHIVCCSMCDECVHDCPYEEEAKRLNEKGGKQ